MAAAVRIGDVELQVAIGSLQDVVYKDDLLAVRRPMAVEMRQSIVGQEPLKIGAVDVHRPQGHLASVDAREQKLVAVGRPLQMLNEIADLGNSDRRRVCALRWRGRHCQECQ